MGKDVFKRVVDAVVIALGEFALIGIAGAAAVGFEAYLVAGRQRQALDACVPAAQVVDGLFGDPASAGFGRQVEDFFSMTQAEGLSRGEQSRDGFADAGGCLGEGATATVDGAVGGYGEVALAGPVLGEGEFERFKRKVALGAPLLVDARPMQVALDEIGAKRRQFVARKGAAVLAVLVGV